MIELESAFLVMVLFLLGLAVLFLIKSRLERRMEQLAGELNGIQELKEKLDSILPEFEEKLGPIRQSLQMNEGESVSRQLKEIQGIVMKLEQKMDRHAAIKPVSDGDPGKPLDLYEEIEKRLKARGFKNISILVESPEETESKEGEVKLPLEAYRGGVAYKGFAILKEGRIVSEQIKPAYEAFP
jgi:hypothetical protein